VIRLAANPDFVEATATLEEQPQDNPAIPRWLLAQIPDVQGALVSLDPDTGAVLALEGGFDFGLNQFNHALQAARSSLLCTPQP